MEKSKLSTWDPVREEFDFCIMCVCELLSVWVGEGERVGRGRGMGSRARLLPEQALPNVVFLPGSKLAQNSTAAALSEASSSHEAREAAGFAVSTELVII